MAGGRGELTYELAGGRGIRCTLIDPRHGCRLTKQQRRRLTEAAAAAAAAGRGEVPSAVQTAAVRAAVRPRRVRARFTEAGLALVGGGGADVMAASKKRPAGDALAAAQMGWDEISSPAEAAALITGCSLVVGLHPDQATEPLVRCVSRPHPLGRIPSKLS